MTNVNYVGKGWYEVRFSSDGDELTFKRVEAPDNPPNVSELDFVEIKQREAELIKQIKELQEECLISRGLFNLSTDNIKQLREENKSLREECRSLESSINRMLND